MNFEIYNTTRHILCALFLAVLALSCSTKDPLEPEDTSQASTVTDIDGNVYKTVKIGNQWWMAENLKAIHYRNGDAISYVADSMLWKALDDGAYCNYTNDEGYVPEYGRLYNWYAVRDNRNLAPEGWHVPDEDDWKQLEMYLGMSRVHADTVGMRGTDEGGKLKEVGTSHWLSPNIGATNESGFTALAGGYRTGISHYSDMAGSASFWSYGEYNNDQGWYRYLINNYGEVGRYGVHKRFGLSIRCVKD